MNGQTTTPSWQALDGVRAISIALVLACHLLPLGPKQWVDLNIAAGQLGMSMFFALSGFLIAHKLHVNPNIWQFSINRFFRIVPLLWLVLLLDFTWRWPHLDIPTIVIHVLTWVNNQPAHYLPETNHLWSVCVEIHFYILAGFAFWLMRHNGLQVLIALGFVLCLYRFSQSAFFDSRTLFRLDELLIPMSAGVIWHSRSEWAEPIRQICSKCNPALPFVILAVCCVAPPVPLLSILRPVFATLLLLSLLYNTNNAATAVFINPAWEWLSKHAYALYIIHPFLLLTWLGSGDKLTAYAKRPLLFLVLFFLAYLSTRYFERFFIQLGKHLAQQVKPNSTIKLTQT